MASLLSPRIKDKVIGPGKPKGVSKSQWERRVRKRVKEAREKQIGYGCSRGNEWDKRAYE